MSESPSNWICRRCGSMAYGLHSDTRCLVAGTESWAATPSGDLADRPSPREAGGPDTPAPGGPGDAEALLKEIHDFARASYGSIAMTDHRGFSDMQTIVNKIRRFWKSRPAVPTFVHPN